MEPLIAMLHMQDALFYGFAALTLFFGLLVVANPLDRNPVTSAMFLVLAIGSLAGLFVLLHAFFLAAVQVLVYAGAVMVLFLFVIMLLDLPAEEKRKPRAVALVLSLAVAGSIGGLFIKTFLRGSLVSRFENPVEGTTAPLGRILFTQYLLPFEIVSLLLLVGIVGVILLSKKDLR